MTQRITLADEYISALEKSKKHDLAVLFFSKIFDRVQHARLLTQLDHYNVRGNTLGYQEDMAQTFMAQYIYGPFMVVMAHI